MSSLNPPTDQLPPAELPPLPREVLETMTICRAYVLNGGYWPKNKDGPEPTSGTLHAESGKNISRVKRFIEEKAGLLDVEELSQIRTTLERLERRMEASECPTNQVDRMNLFWDSFTLAATTLSRSYDPLLETLNYRFCGPLRGPPASKDDIQ